MSGDLESVPVRSLRAWAERAALHLRFMWLRQRDRRLVLERIENLSLLVFPEVFHPGLFLSSRLLAAALEDQPLHGKRVLDMGTGSGFLALLAARRARWTVGTDINPEAVRALKINALLNRLDDRVEGRQGDLFVPVAGERFDLILFNPPYFAGVAPVNEPWERSWRDTDQTRGRFVAEAARFLAPAGRLLVVDSDRAVDPMERALAAAGFRVTPLRSQPVGSAEVLSVFAASRPD